MSVALFPHRPRVLTRVPSMTALLSVNKPGQGATAEGEGLFVKEQRAAFSKETILPLILRCQYLPAFHAVTQTFQVPTFC